MAITLSYEDITLINAEDSDKVLATISPEGEPHAVRKESLHVNSEGLLEYYELIESSLTNRNMVYSLWHNKTVSINVRNGERSIQIKGTPERVLIAGAAYEEIYRELRKDGTDIDLSGIWRITPLEIRDETFAKRWEVEDAAHPILRHLDRLLTHEE